jgi:hypothetical protein
MNRRTFLRTLGLATAALYVRLAPSLAREVQPVMWWTPQTRLAAYYSQEYLDALDKIMAGHVDDYIIAFNGRQTSRTYVSHIMQARRDGMTEHGIRRAIEGCYGDSTGDVRMI